MFAPVITPQTLLINQQGHSTCKYNHLNIGTQMLEELTGDMDPIVHLSASASLKGTITYVEGSDKPVYTFHGVPFAEPPIGELRLKKPVPKKLWEGERDATKFGPAPIQDMEMVRVAFAQYEMKFADETSEDCLYLSIYTPTMNTSASLPVMVWIYGGAFRMGFVDSYEGTAFSALHDIVLVLITYRVGPLGFFSTGDETCPGNFGLWDQVEGMKWVQEYIHNFGGDQNNVTLFGVSAGASSTSFHHVAKPSLGLFKRSIHFSGTGTVVGSLLTQQQNHNFCSQAAKAIELPGDSSPAEVHAALMEMPADELCKKLATVLFSPNLDGEFLKEDSLTSYKNGDFYKCNSIYTVNTHEGNLMYNFGYKPAGMEIKTRDDLPAFLNAFSGQQRYFVIKDISGFVNALMEEYFPWENPTEDELLMTTIEMIGDAIFFAQIDAFAKLHSNGVPGGTYFGVYGYRWSKSQCIPLVKADHGEDVPITFGFPLLRQEPLGEEYTESDKKMTAAMLAYICNFAKTGNPNGPSSTHLPTWPCFTTDKPFYLYLDEKCSVGEEYKPSRRRFWATMPQKFSGEVPHEGGTDKK